MSRFNTSDLVGSASRPSDPDERPEDWEDLLLKYALGDLSPEELKTFQQLIVNYPELEPGARAAIASLESLPLPLVDPATEEAVTEAEQAVAKEAVTKQAATEQPVMAVTEDVAQFGDQAGDQFDDQVGDQFNSQPDTLLMRPMQTLLPTDALSDPLPWQMRLPLPASSSTLLPVSEGYQSANVPISKQRNASGLSVTGLLENGQSANSQSTNSQSANSQSANSQSANSQSADGSSASHSPTSHSNTRTQKIGYRYHNQTPVEQLPKRDRPKVKPARRDEQRPGVSVLTAGVAIALSTVAVAGFISYRLYQQLQTTTAEKEQAQAIAQARTRELLEQNSLQNRNQAVLQALRQPDAIVYDLRPADEMFKDAFGRLIVVPSNAEATLTFRNLPAISTSQVYRLWAIASASTKPFYCGELSAALTRTEVWTLPTAQCSQPLQKIFITLEAGDKAAAPTGNVILSGD